MVISKNDIEERVLSSKSMMPEGQFAAQHSDTTAEVLWECCKQGIWYGMTDNYLRVVTASLANLECQITPARLGAATDLGMSYALHAEPMELSSTR